MTHAQGDGIAMADEDTEGCGVMEQDTGDVNQDDQEEVHRQRRENPFDKDDDVHREFKNVDRDSEDLMVKEYKDSEDEQVLHDLYMLREPTLKVWARKYAYLGDSEDDVFADLRTVWLRCISKYKYAPGTRPVRTRAGAYVKDDNGKIKTVFKRTPFNTFLYTSLRNHVSNIIKKKYSKKRLDDNGMPLEGNMRSLDYAYGEGDGDGDGETLYGLLPDTKAKPPDFDSGHIIDEISKGDQEVRRALEDFVADVHLKRLSTACRLCRGVLPLSRRNRGILQRGGDKAHKLLRGMIEFSGKFGKEFRITSYSVMSDRVSYEVYGQDTKLFRKVMKAVEAYKAKAERKS